MKLIDNHNRHIHKLRVSLTDSCNMRCFYCMPENSTFAKVEEKLSGQEVIEICEELSKLTIDEIRLTGGEPLLHSDFTSIVEGVGKLPLKKFGVTTNALKLEQHLPLLKANNCTNINVSLDSLIPKRYAETTGVDALPDVIRAIKAAKQEGMHVKINTVIMRGINDDELLSFVDFAAENDIEVRFLEIMKIGAILDRFEDLFISANDLLSMIKDKGHEATKLLMPVDSTSFNYRISKDGKEANIGFIASESTHFCSSCSRLRLNSKGVLRPCLMTPTGVDLKSTPKEKYREALLSILPDKPLSRIEKLTQPMHQIGG